MAKRLSLTVKAYPGKLVEARKKADALAAKTGRPVSLLQQFFKTVRGSAASGGAYRQKLVWTTYDTVYPPKQNPAAPTRPPITRQWKPMLVRTNAQGQVQVAVSGSGVTRTRSANPSKLAKVDFPAIAHLMRKDFFALSSDEKRELLAEADRVKYRLPANASGSRARYFYDAVERMQGRKRKPNTRTVARKRGGAGSTRKRNSVWGNIDKKPKLNFKIAGVPKDYASMPFGRRIEYANTIKQFKSVANTGWMSIKRTTLASAWKEFKALHNPTQWYFEDTSAPGYRDDSVQVWYTT